MLPSFTCPHWNGAGNLNATLGNNSALAPDQLASGFLPLSLFEMLRDDGESIPIVLAILRSGNLFSIERNQGSVEGMETSVGSPVVSLTVGVDRTFTNLPDPVVVNVRIMVEVSRAYHCNIHHWPLTDILSELHKSTMRLLRLWSTKYVQII